LPVTLQIRAEIQQGMGQQLPMLKQYWHQQTTDTPVTIDERMNRLKLIMNNASLMSAGQVSTDCRYVSSAWSAG
jgi:hypothetical protein